MDEDTVIETIISYLDRQFPKDCKSCGMVYSSLAEYIKNTSMVGDPVSYDIEENEWNPELPLGTFAFANCKCGSTITLSSKNLGRYIILRLMMWARIEIRKRDVTIKELLGHLRSEVRRRVLDESDRE